MNLFLSIVLLVGRVTSTLPVPVLLPVLHMCTVHGKSTKVFHYSRYISITPCLDQNLYARLTAKWRALGPSLLMVHKAIYGTRNFNDCSYTMLTKRTQSWYNLGLYCRMASSLCSSCIVGVQSLQPLFPVEHTFVPVHHVHMSWTPILISHNYCCILNLKYRKYSH